MVTIDADAASQDGVTLVTATVAGADAPIRITLASCLDGPVWPPRRQGEPAAGWTDDGFEGVVPADGRLALGFASPADPVDPPLELVATEPAEAPADAMDTPAAVLRGLGDPTPPSLVDPEHDVEAASAQPTIEAADSDADRESCERQADCRFDPAAPDALPPAVADWLDAIESRVETAEALSTDASVDRATRALRACGGAERAREIDERLSADVDRLRGVEERVASLAERAEAVTVAREALDRLA